MEESECFVELDSLSHNVFEVMCWCSFPLVEVSYLFVLFEWQYVFHVFEYVLEVFLSVDDEFLEVW